MGRREQKKLLTTERIARAARELFHRKGFEATTTHEIALAAGIAPATLFGYVDTKEDVLVLALVREAVEQVESIRKSIPQGLSTLDGVVFTFRGMMEYHARAPDLHYRFLREIGFNIQRAPLARLMGEALRAVIADIVRRAQADGELRRDVAAEEISWLLFAHYWNAIRHFYSVDRSIDAFDKSLRRALLLQFQGLASPSRAPALAPARIARWRTARNRRAVKG